MVEVKGSNGSSRKLLKEEPLQMFSAFDSSAIIEASQEHTSRSISSTQDHKNQKILINDPSETTSATTMNLHHEDLPPLSTDVSRYDALVHHLNSVVT